MIKSNSVRAVCNCDERASLGAMVDQFAAAMKEKLWKKLEVGYAGWDEPDDFSEADLWERIQEQLVAERKVSSLHEPKPLDPVDVGNFAAMIFNMRQGETP